MHNNPFHEEILPDAQPDPPQAQLEAISCLNSKSRPYFNFQQSTENKGNILGMQCPVLPDFNLPCIQQDKLFCSSVSSQHSNATLAVFSQLPERKNTYFRLSASNLLSSFRRPPFLNPWKCAAGAPTVITSYRASGMGMEKQSHLNAPIPKSWQHCDIYYTKSEDKSISFPGNN